MYIIYTQRLFIILFIINNMFYNRALLVAMSWLCDLEDVKYNFQWIKEFEL